MQVEHTADCFGGAWFKSPLSTEVWHPRHICDVMTTWFNSLQNGSTFHLTYYVSFWEAFQLITKQTKNKHVNNTHATV